MTITTILYNMSNTLARRIREEMGWATGKIGSQEQRKRKCKRKRRSLVERKRKQNEIRTRISVPYDGGNLVPKVPVTLEQQSGSEDSGNEIKDVGRRRCFRIVFCLVLGRRLLRRRRQMQRHTVF